MGKLKGFIKRSIKRRVAKLLRNPAFWPALAYMALVLFIVFFVIGAARNAFEALGEPSRPLTREIVMNALKNMPQNEREQFKDSIIDIENLPKYLEYEANTALKDKPGKIRVITNGTSWEESCNIKYGDATRDYMLPWQFFCAIDSMAGMRDKNRDKILNLAFDVLKPEYKYEAGKYTRDEVEKTKVVTRTYKNGQLDKESVSITSVTRKYPLPYLDKIVTAFAEHTFYTEKKTWDQGWQEVWSTSYSWEAEAKGKEKTDDMSDTEEKTVDKYVETTVCYKQNMVIEDVLSRMETKINTSKFNNFLMQSGITHDDLYAMQGLMEQMPDNDKALDYFSIVMAQYEFCGPAMTPEYIEFLKNITETGSYPKESNIGEWLCGPGNLTGCKSWFLMRLAALAKDYGSKMEITSGYRSIDEQKAIWDNTPASMRGIYVALPGYSKHNYGVAVDVSGCYRKLANIDLAKYGLYKPMSYEDWHIEPIETKYTQGGT